MRVRIFTQHFYPETVATGRRALDLAESLAGQGHDVVVITGVPNHPSSLRLPFCQDVVREERVAQGYRILRVSVFRSPNGSPLIRLLTYASYMLSAAWCGLRGARPDVIIAISPLPTGLAAVPASLWHRAPLVYDLQDIWPASARAVGVMKQGPALRVLKQVERIFYRFCTLVVGVAEGFKDYLVDLGLPPERIVVIPNGVHWEMFAGAPLNRAGKQSAALNGRFVVGYIGNMGLAQGLDTVLEAAEHLRNEPVAFLLMGEGVDKPRLVASAKTRGLEAIYFRDGRPRQEVPSVLGTCDALLVILRQDPLFEITIPSKIYEYMAAGKPVLCSVGGEAARLIVESKCGLPVRPSDGRALAQGIRMLMCDPQRCRVLGEAGAARAQAYFSRTNLMKTYGSLLEGLAKTPPQPSA